MAELKKEELDILDQIKHVETAIRNHLLMKEIAQLKRMAKECLVIEEKTTAILEELGVADKDVKRVIDFVNNSREVELSPEEKKEIRQEVKNRLKKERAGLEEKIVAKKEDSQFIGMALSSSGQTTGYNYHNALNKLALNPTWEMMSTNLQGKLDKAAELLNVDFKL